jgi:hypothetical protein
MPRVAATQQRRRRPGRPAIVNATDGADTIAVNGSAGTVTINGLAATVTTTHAEAGDRLDINRLAGTDTVDSSDLAPGVIQLFVDGLPV